MRKLIPEMIFAGTSIAFYSSIFAVMINDCIKSDPRKSEEEND